MRRLIGQNPVVLSCCPGAPRLRRSDPDFILPPLRGSEDGISLEPLSGQDPVVYENFGKKEAKLSGAGQHGLAIVRSALARPLPTCG